MSSATAAPIDEQTFEAHRQHLFGVAYRLLGSASEAEDVVQDAWLRTREVGASTIQSTEAYLTTVVTRLALDHLRSARQKREVYVGPWLPEPVLTTDLAPPPGQHVEREEDVSTAFLMLLERLTPEERATYVLREAFDYPYDDIAAVLHKSTPAVRQISSRARKHITEARARYRVSKPERDRLAGAFLQAVSTGDLHQLQSLLVDSAVAIADAGASRQSARRPIFGADRISRWLAGLSGKAFSLTEMTLEEVNGVTAGLFWGEGELQLVMLPYATDEGIERIHMIRSIEKLAWITERIRARDGALPTAPVT